MTKPEEHKLYILLLEAEIEALRSVLSEFEGDKMEYSQMGKANACQDLRLYLKRTDWSEE